MLLLRSTAHIPGKPRAHDLSRFRQRQCAVWATPLPSQSRAAKCPISHPLVGTVEQCRPSVRPQAEAVSSHELSENGDETRSCVGGIWALIVWKGEHMHSFSWRSKQTGKPRLYTSMIIRRHHHPKPNPAAQSDGYFACMPTVGRRHASHRLPRGSG